MTLTTRLAIAMILLVAVSAVGWLSYRSRKSDMARMIRKALVD